MATRKRKSTGKRLRFEIFKRDGFRCVYCGATPVQEVLHIDHVIPVADGGTNDAENMVTSCQSCNSGKSSVSLGDKKLSKPLVTESHKEHAEQIREYLQVQKEIAAARREAAEQISEHWESILGPMSQDMFNRLIVLVQEWPAEKLIEAISIVSRKFPKMEKFDTYGAINRAKYFSGVLRNWRTETKNGEG